MIRTPPIWVIAVTSCAASVPTPPRATHAPTAPVVVSEPPPAAIPETISEPPLRSDDAVWVDGTWHWSIGRWVWHRGGWVNPPRNVAFFPGAVEYTKQGTLRYWPPGWVNAAGELVAEPRRIQPAASPASDRTVEGLFR